MLPLLLALVTMLAPQPPPPEAVQFAAVGPDAAVIIAAGDDTVVPFDTGAVAGVDVFASDGNIAPRGACAVTLAAASVGASGPVHARIQVGRRGHPGWTDIGRSVGGGQVVPMTAARLAPGQSLRLYVRNDAGREVSLTPIETRMAVVALDCGPARLGRLDADRSMFSWLRDACVGQPDGPACEAELIRHYNALHAFVGADGRPPDGPSPRSAAAGAALDRRARAFYRAAPILLMLRGA